MLESTDDLNGSSVGRRKVFGIGFNKTGTSTLGACLRELGYNHVSHSRRMLSAYVEGNYGAIIEETRRYDSFEDWPWPLLFRQFYAEYGDNACYVLTVRSSADKWLDSLKKHSLTTNPDRPMRSVMLGYKYPHGYEEEHIRQYEEHNSSVRNYFAARPHVPFIELCWEKGDGWAELCGLLGCEQPDVPFPHIKPNESGIASETIERNRAYIEAQLRAIAER